MKKYFLGTVFLAVFSVFGFYACNDVEPLKEDRNPTIGSSISSQVYYTRADLQSKSLVEIRAIFNQISSQNRYDLVEDKLNHCLSLNPNTNQSAIISDVLNEISPNTFTWGSVEHNQFTQTYLPANIISLGQEFTNQAGLNVFYHLYDLDYLDDPDPIQDGGGSTQEDCGCGQSSAFGACQVLGNSCAGESCGESSHGCGFGGMFDCDGLCDDVPEPSSTATQLYQ
jgi:hypothetical protein